MKHQIEVTGHRGAAAVEPENTLRGFHYALSLGVNYVELDVHLSKDDELIVMHDAAVDRTTNGSGQIADMTLAEIKRLDAGQGESVPTLHEVVATFQAAWAKGSQTRLKIELKGPNTAQPTVACVQHYGIEDRVVLSSFDAERVAEAKKLLPQAACAFISSKLDPDPLKIALRIGAGAVNLQHKSATREMVERAHAAGLQVCVWTIDEAKLMKAAIDLGVDGICSNKPQLLLEVLAGRA